MLHSAAKRKRACKKERNSTQVCVCVCVHACVVRQSVMSNSLWPMGCSLPGSSVHGILQARILEWVAIPFSRGHSQTRNWTWISVAGGFFTVWATREPLYPGQDVKSDSVHHETSLCYHLNTWVSQELLLPSPWKPTFHDRVGDLKRNQRGGHLMPSCGGLAQGTWHPCQVTLEKAQVE